MLASSSRNVLKNARIAHALLDAPAARIIPRQASTAVAAGQIFSYDEGNQQHGLRRGPYSRQPNSSFRPGGRTRVERYNLDINKLIGFNKMHRALRLCQQMKEEGLKPDLTTYGYILEACAKGAHYLEARAVFEDMLAMGLQPTRHHCNLLLHSIPLQSTDFMWEILDTMKRMDIEFDETTYEIIILRYADSDNIELALQYLAELGSLGLAPTLKTAQGIIISASKLGFPRLALDLAEAFETTSVRRLESDVWMELLISCSDNMFMDGVLRTWQKVVHELNVVPDEGCCLQVLHTAGRHGLSKLSFDVLQVLANRLNVSLQEHHLAPVIEALAKENKIQEALDALTLIRSYNITPVADTAYPIFTAISTSTDAVDEAWGHLETLREKGKTVDVTAWNVIIQASVALGDLQRAVGTYSAAGSLGVTPDVETYNLLLAGCIVAQHRALGDRLLTEMKAAKVAPDVRTYERLVVLCLTQANYEDAFFYLEEMKTEGHAPPLAVYEAIVRKCVQVGDSRYKLALEEMQECKYQVSPRLQAFINSGGVTDVPEDEQKRRRDRQSNRHVAGRPTQEEVVETQGA